MSVLLWQDQGQQLRTKWQRGGHHLSRLREVWRSSSLSIRASACEGEMSRVILWGKVQDSQFGSLSACAGFIV